MTDSSKIMSISFGFISAGVTVELITNTIIVAFLTGLVGGIAGYIANMIMKKLFKE